MNRFTVERIAHEASVNGKSVLIVCRDNTQATLEFDRVDRVSTGVRARSRANGAARIEFASGGRVDFRSVQGGGERGMDADFVVIADEATRRLIEVIADKRASLRAVIRARDGEIIEP